MSTALELTIDIAARPETVFGFLTEPALFREWMGAASTMSTDGSRSFSIPYPSGDEAVGDVLEIDRPRRVVYSWGYREGRHGLAPGASRVEIVLEPTPLGTRVRLRHLGLPSAGISDAHRLGWLFYLGTLGARAGTRQADALLPRLLERWTEAWNTADPSALTDCCSDAVVYLDRMACVRGRDALAGYIRNARAFAPGAVLTVSGEPSITQQYVRFTWQMRDGDRPIGAGMAFAEVHPDDGFSRVVSFWN